ncbi:MAG: hypothetical protein QOJ12_1309, partial [Thermoleophilales bacterium]|nr:hypothetical protein [Thermoleophilales bacterium]
MTAKTAAAASAATNRESERRNIEYLLEWAYWNEAAPAGVDQQPVTLSGAVLAIEPAPRTRLAVSMRPLLALAAAVLLLAVVAVGSAGAATPPRRTFGVYVDPWHVGEWRSAGIAPDYVGRFEAFSRQATVDSFLREAERQTLGSVLVTWEPWKPVPANLGVAEQAKPQPGYRNADIAHGAQDAYILEFARSLASFRGRVYLRYAHEMNGTWYPWSQDPIAYRQAWRHIWRLFQSVGARNVSFVWSPNPSLFLPFSTWQRSVRVYWPGRRYVDAVGSTMI